MSDFDQGGIQMNWIVDNERTGEREESKGEGGEGRRIDGKMDEKRVEGEHV